MIFGEGREGGLSVVSLCYRNAQSSKKAGRPRTDRHAEPFYEQACAHDE